MTITASLVSELRKLTGAGLMECKKVLTETKGDIDAAVEQMRLSGAAKASKKAGRVAAEGVITFAVSDDAKKVVIFETNCETDFVARDENFKSFTKTITEQALNSSAADVSAFGQEKNDATGKTIEEMRTDLIAKIGENITIRRFDRVESSNNLSFYCHHDNRIGVLVEFTGGDQDLGKGIAMHIAASQPIVVNPTDIPQDLLDKEREIYSIQAQESGKPQDVIEKMVQGRLNKFCNEMSLLGQPFIKDPSTTIEDVLNRSQAKVIRFVRFEVGEGIDKKEVDFAKEVAEQVKGS